MSKVSALRNSKSRLGEFGHLQASQAAALLTTETYRLMRGPSAGSAADFARELERAAEEIAMKIAQHPSTTTLLRSPRSTVDARLALADQTLAVQKRLTDIAELRVRQGVDLPDEASRAQAQLAAAREMRAAISSSGQIRLAALASLVGVAPAELPKLTPRPLPEVSGGLPAGASLDLVARRPDIAASRWQVEAALKQTDVARAQFLPDLSISALAGLSSIDLGQLFTASSRTFSLTPALHLPLFNSGLLQANYGLSKAQLDSAVAQYNSVVLQAARDVATQALTAQMLAERRTQQEAQLAADERLLAAAKARAAQGVRDARESLAAHAQLLQQHDAAVQLQAQAVSTDLALIKALGGGYRMPSSGTESPAPSSSHATAGASADERH